MRLNLAHNWIAKILSLLLATAIWFLIKNHLKESGETNYNIQRGIPVDEQTLKPLLHAKPQ